MGILVFLNKLFGYSNEEKKSENLQKTYLNVPYKDKDAAKNLGAKWDASKKQWFIPDGVHKDGLEKWLPSTMQDLIIENLRSEYFYLAQTEKECFKCHKHTIVNAIVLPEGFESIDEEALDDHNEETPFFSNDYPSILSYISYISPEALLEIQKHTDKYSLHYSNATDSIYFMSKCQCCSTYQGDNFTISEFNSPFSPVKVDDFSTIIFHKITVLIGVNVGGWSVGYPPFEYYLGDDTVDGSMYVRIN